VKVDYVKVADWIRENWKASMKCPVCETNDWRIGEDVVEIRPFIGHSVETVGNVYPFVQLFCSKCGYVIFFNAVISGIVDPKSFIKAGSGAPLKNKKEG